MLAGQNIRDAVRILLQARGFTAVIDPRDRREPLPFRDQDQLVRLNETEAAPGRVPICRTRLGGLEEAAPDIPGHDAVRLAGETIVGGGPS